MREEFFGKLFVLGGFIGATDTYKRTMWTAVPDIALQHARDPVPADCRRHLRRVPIGQGTAQQAEASRRARDYVLDRQS